MLITVPRAAAQPRHPMRDLDPYDEEWDSKICADCLALALQYTGETLLHLASENGRLEVVRLLLAKGANIEAEKPV